MSFKINKPMSHIDHNYTPIAKELNINTLESSREYNDLLLLYKVCKEITIIDSLNSNLEIYTTTRDLRKRDMLFTVPYKYRDFSSKSISYRMSTLANNNLKNIDFFNDNFRQIKIKLSNKIKKY